MHRCAGAGGRHAGSRMCPVSAGARRFGVVSAQRESTHTGRCSGCCVSVPLPRHRGRKGCHLQSLFPTAIHTVCFWPQQCEAVVPVQQQAHPWFMPSRPLVTCRSFLKQILDEKLDLEDLRSVDEQHHSGLTNILKNPLQLLGMDGLTFTTETSFFGHISTVDLIPNGSQTLASTLNCSKRSDLCYQVAMAPALFRLCR